MQHGEGLIEECLLLGGCGWEFPGGQGKLGEPDGFPVALVNRFQMVLEFAGCRRGVGVFFGIEMDADKIDPIATLGGPLHKPIEPAVGFGCGSRSGGAAESHASLFEQRPKIQRLRNGHVGLLFMIGFVEGEQRVAVAAGLFQIDRGCGGFVPDHRDKRGGLLDLRRRVDLPAVEPGNVESLQSGVRAIVGPETDAFLGSRNGSGLGGRGGQGH